MQKIFALNVLVVILPLFAEGEAAVTSSHDAKDQSTKHIAIATALQRLKTFQNRKVVVASASVETDHQESQSPKPCEAITSPRFASPLPVCASPIEKIGPGGVGKRPMGTPVEHRNEKIGPGGLDYGRPMGTPVEHRNEKIGPGGLRDYQETRSPKPFENNHNNDNELAIR